MLRLSSNWGVVTPRAVRGVLMNGVFTLLKLPLLPVALTEGKIFGKSGFASPCVNRKKKRAKPTMNSLFIFYVSCERHSRDRFFDARKTSPSGANPGKTCGRALSGSRFFVFWSA